MLDTSTDMRQNKPQNSTGTVGNGAGSNGISTCPLLLGMSCNKQNNNQQAIVIKFKNKLNHTIRTTYMLVLLSKWFVIFHVPYFVCWMIYHIYMNKYGGSTDGSGGLFGVMTSSSNQHESSPSPLMSGVAVTTVDNNLSTNSIQSENGQLDPNTILTLRAFLNLFEILFLFNYTVHFFLYLFNIPSFKRAHANEVRRFLRKFGLCKKSTRNI